MKKEPNKAVERSRLLVTVRAEHGLRQATVWLIMTLGRNMKFRCVAWFWFGVASALSAGDAISYRLRDSVRFPEPLFALPIWMAVSTLPALAFLIGSRILAGMFPSRTTGSSHWLFVLSGAGYIVLSACAASLPGLTGKTLGMITAYCAPFLVWLILSKKIKNDEGA